MPDYCAYFVNDAGNIVKAESIKSLTENDALEAARCLLVRTRFLDVEVWDLSKRIGVIHRD